MRDNSNKKSNILRSALLVFTLAVQFPLFGQIKEIRNVPSPEVASLGTFGSVPVGHYTGTPNIAIPLYNISVGNLNIPIQALYHTANVKPHTPPTSLGIGWVLSAGGYIARTVKGCQDEEETYSTKAGYYFNHSKIKEIDNSSNQSETLKNLTHLEGNDWYEISADEFVFNFMGYSGSFYMDKDGVWRVNSDQNIKVEFNESNGFIPIDNLEKRFPLQYYGCISTDKLFFNKFTLITPDGVRYEFGGENATEYSIPYYNQVTKYVVATCWRLSKITTLDKKEITFDYADDSYMCDIHFAPQMINYYIDNRGVGQQRNYGRTGYSGFLTMPARLMKITTPNEEVNFSYKRDPNYGNLFLENTGCLYWEDNPNYNYFRYEYGTLENEFNRYRFMLFTGVKPKNSEAETRTAIAQKITQDYLENFVVKKDNIPVLNVSFDRRLIKNRPLLAGIEFNIMDLDNIKPISPFKGNLKSNEEFVNNSTQSLLQIKKDTFNNKALLNDPDNTVPVYPGKSVIFPDTLPRIKTDKTVYEYKFNYYNEDNEDLLWPRRNPLTYTDSWGYYSNFGSNPLNRGEWALSTMPTEDQFTEQSASLESTKSYVLKEIIYPTGGKSLFDYELNDYSKQFDIKQEKVINAYGTSGGLRVNSINNYDSDNNLLYSKKYYYRENINSTVSSGISKGKTCLYDRIYFNSDKSEYIDFYSFDPIVPYPLNFNTPDVGYSTVIEDVRDANNNLLKRTRYRYTNYDTDLNNISHMDIPPSVSANVFGSYASAPFTSLAFERGKLVSEESMDASNNIIAKSTYSYIRSAGDSSSIVAQEYHLRYEPAELGYSLFAYSFLYKTYTNRYLVDIQKTVENMANGTLTTSTDYDYNNYGMPSRKTISSNSGQNEITTYKYSYDNNPAYQWMTDKNILWPTEVRVENGNVFSGNVKSYAQSSLGVPYISEQKSYLSDNPNSNWEGDVDFTVERADQFGNSVVRTQKGVQSIMIWSCLGQKLVAVIENATYDEVKNALGKAPEEFSALENSDDTYSLMNSLRSKLPDAHVATYVYDDKLNLTSETDPNGLSYLYSYDLLGRLISKSWKTGFSAQTVNEYKYNYKTKN